jgi:procollagen-proline 3-dioxygenase 1
MCAVFLYLPTN